MSMSDKRLSINFVLGPTGDVLTAGAASIMEYARGLSERGHLVSFTTWPKFLWQHDRPFPGLDSKFPVFYDAGAKPDALPIHLLDKSPRDYVGELQYFLAFLNLVTPAIPKSDLIVAGNWEGVIPAWQSRRGKPVHFPQHYDEVSFTLDGTSTVGLRANPLIKMLCRSALQMPACRVANSSWLAGEFRRRFGESIPFVQNGVDTARFHPLPKLSARDGAIRVVTYCRPEQWKGFQDAVPAMHDLMQRHDRIQWHVYGFPHPALKPDNELAPYQFHGVLNHDDLSRLYSESDIALCPSWYEGFATPPLEAMACGTAVITTRYGTEDYAIDGHNAIVTRPRVVSDLAVALDGLVRVPELCERLARNGRAMAESLTWDAAVSAREELLYRIHANELPIGLQGFQNGIVDGHGVSFENLTADFAAPNGALLAGADGEHYLVESSRLRRVRDPRVLGIDPDLAQQVDLLTLLRNTCGPDITSLADCYGPRTHEKNTRNQLAAQ
jgi:glycosyltransferase involved in cell wall biosynthesis